MDNEQQQQTPPSPSEALQFLDGILAGVAGSRKDHIAIQGALGIVGQALASPPADKPDIAPPADESGSASEDTEDSK